MRQRYHRTEDQKLGPGLALNQDFAKGIGFKLKEVQNTFKILNFGAKFCKSYGPGRALERKFSRGYEGRYRAPKSYWAPQALSGPMPLNHFFVRWL